ncbi:hypothetical protein ACHHYP_10209 [Achlya hypogyna]|uniref:NADPH--hemoprotein reductase n=1 Tax=Achlya hypogyna TaxID=1202772 RepID=A0A1V9ZHZ2_ACHHY|nr:hypothetical protein ACHHYP_10209 [Achlya hypogyna]
MRAVRASGRRWPRGQCSLSMDAFMEFERELARKRRAEQPPQAPKTLRLQPPVKPADGDCCNLNCPNCVLLVYQEQLLEYEDSVRWSEMGEVPTIAPPPVDTQLTQEGAPERVAELPPGAAPLKVQRSEKIAEGVHHLEVALPTPYETADNLVVHMHNPPDFVAQMAARLGVDPRATIRVDTCSNLPPMFLGTWTTIGTLLTWAVDLASPLRPRHLRRLAAYATDPSEQQAILSMAQQWKADGDAPNVVGLLAQHMSLALSLEAFLAEAPPLGARQYTLASSPAAHPTMAAITVSLKSRGRCAVYLAAASDTIHGYVKRSSFSVARPPPQAPLLCIGTGTGIAPFRALVQQRAAQGRPWPKMALFQGCRSKAADWLYADELATAKADGVLTEWRPVFSGTNPDAKVYVQDELKARAPLVASYLVQENGVVFVCGSLAMGRDVKHAIVACLESALDWSTEDAKAYVALMQDTGRYIAEVW